MLSCHVNNPSLDGVLIQYQGESYYTYLREEVKAEDM